MLRTSSLTAALVLALSCLGLGLRAAALSVQHPFPVYDEVEYLQTAQRFAADGGVFAALGGYWRGVEREELRHPLYMLVLTPFMRLDAGDFPRAKTLSVACALLLVLTVYLSARPVFGEEAAQLAAAFAAASPVTAVHAQIVACDWLFSAAFVAGTLLLCRPRIGTAAWAAFGALAGAAYLAKGSGHFMLLAVPAAALPRWGRDSWRRREPWLALAAFAATASPLLWRNALVWHDPFHNVISRMMWADGPDDYTVLSSLRMAGSPLLDRVGPASYWQRHGALESLMTLASGGALTFRELVSAFSIGPSQPVWRLATGSVLAASALFGVLERRRSGAGWEVLAVAAPSAAMLAACAWLAKGSHTQPRFVYPAAAALLPWSCAGLARLLSLERVSAAAVLCAASLAAAGAAQFTAARAAPARLPAFWAPTSRWIADNVDAGGYLIDGWSLYSNWDRPPQKRRGFDFSASAEELAAVAERNGISAAVLDLSILPAERDPGKFGPDDTLGPTTFLGWPRCFPATESPNPLRAYARRCPP